MNSTNLHQKAEFTGKNIFAGIDVHEKSWNVTLYYEQDYLRTFSQPPSTDSLLNLLRRDYPGANYVCGYESGFTGFWIQRKLENSGVNCKVLHAADIPKSGKQKIIKTDSVDSKNIAQALAAGLVKSVHVPDIETEQDRSLLRHRSRLQRDITRCKNRIRSLLFQYGIDIKENYSKSWSKNFIKWLLNIEEVSGSSRIALNHMIDQLQLLRKSLLQINLDIRKLQLSEKYKQHMELLMSVPGIGPLTAIIFITEIENIRRFGSFRQLNSFVGLYPMEYSSGEKEFRGSITMRKNKLLRSLLIEAAWIAVRHDPALTQVFQQWKIRMTAKRAIVKIARKLLKRIRFVLMNETLYVTGIIK